MASNDSFALMEIAFLRFLLIDWFYVWTFFFLWSISDVDQRFLWTFLLRHLEFLNAKLLFTQFLLNFRRIQTFIISVEYHR